MLKHFILSKNHPKKAALAFIFFALLSGLSCGKRKPPLPPVEKIQQRGEISGLQRGKTVILTWTLPAKNPADGKTSGIVRADVYRLAEAVNSPLTLSAEEFASRSSLISTVPVGDSDFVVGKQIFIDNLEFTGQAVRLRYAIRFVNSSGQKAAFSNFLLLESLAGTALPPTALQGEVLEDKIRLSWKSPTANVDNSTPANIIGFNIYRTETGGATLLNKSPVTVENYNDVPFEFEKKYQYFARTISLGTDGEMVESGDSNVFEISAKDNFKPQPPASLTIAAAPKNLSIFFAANREMDIAGYKVFRSTDASLPKSEWRLLNAELLTTNTFQDLTIESGTMYFYYITAVDRAGNVSDPSEIVSETAP